MSYACQHITDSDLKIYSRKLQNCFQKLTEVSAWRIHSKRISFLCPQQQLEPKMFYVIAYLSFLPLVSIISVTLIVILILEGS